MFCAMYTLFTPSAYVDAHVVGMRYVGASKLLTLSSD